MQAQGSRASLGSREFSRSQKGTRGRGGLRRTPRPRHAALGRTPLRGRRARAAALHGDDGLPQEQGEAAWARPGDA